MPINFEVAATNCKLAREILDVGIEAYKSGRDPATAYSYTCVENVELTPSATQIFLTLYVLGLIPTLIGWAVLYRRRAPVDAFFKWGICCVVLPAFGPFVALLSFVKLPEAIARYSVAGSWQEVGNPNADDPH